MWPKCIVQIVLCIYNLHSLLGLTLHKSYTANNSYTNCSIIPRTWQTHRSIDDEQSKCEDTQGWEQNRCAGVWWVDEEHPPSECAARDKIGAQEGADTLTRAGRLQLLSAAPVVRSTICDPIRLAFVHHHQLHCVIIGCLQAPIQRINGWPTDWLSQQQAGHSSIDTLINRNGGKLCLCVWITVYLALFRFIQRFFFRTICYLYLSGGASGGLSIGLYRFNLL